MTFTLPPPVTAERILRLAMYKHTNILYTNIQILTINRLISSKLRTFVLSQILIYQIFQVNYLQLQNLWVRTQTLMAGRPFQIFYMRSVYTTCIWNKLLHFDIRNSLKIFIINVLSSKFNHNMLFYKMGLNPQPSYSEPFSKFCLWLNFKLNN